jgi:hypothetical protein
MRQVRRLRRLRRLRRRWRHLRNDLQFGSSGQRQHP